MKHLRFYEVLKTMDPDFMPYWGHMPSDHALRKLWPLSVRPRSKSLPGWYGEYLSSREWRERRAVVLILSMYKCNRCGSRAHTVHHLTYDRRGEERLSDLEPVCRRCHDAIHGRTKRLGVLSIRDTLADVLNDTLRKAQERARSQKL